MYTMLVLHRVCRAAQEALFRACLRELQSRCSRRMCEPTAASGHHVVDQVFSPKRCVALVPSCILREMDQRVQFLLNRL